MFSFNKWRDTKPVAKLATGWKKSERQSQVSDGFIALALFWSALVLFGLFLSFVIETPPGAHVGDTLDFHAGAPLATGSDTKVQAQLVAGPWAPPTRSCTLDVSVMEKTGGEMSVMAVRPDGVMLFWAGGATATGKSDCKGNESIIVATDGYAQLQIALAPKRYSRVR
jgi:hypothetical protein